MPQVDTANYTSWNDLHLSPVALDLGFFELRWYSLAYLAGIFIGYWYLLKLLKKPGAPMARRHADDLIFYAALGIILGGRIGYVLFYNLSEYLKHPLEIFKLWDGGMSFHGGVVGTTLGILYLARKEKLNWLRVHDYVACCAPIGLFLGRLANFVNHELWGAPTTVPWAIRFPELAPNGMMALGPPRHPSQLYEALLEGLVLFAILAFMFWKTKARYEPGKLVGAFIFFYGIFRFGLEFIREPDAQLIGFVQATGLHMGQWAFAAHDRGRRLPHGHGEEAARSRRTDPWNGEHRLNPLERALRQRIRTEGPISVEAYMEACNAYYYATRDPFGTEGDFTTAPEISQMFGEILGAALADCWDRAGRPAVGYAELGPGRGTLAADALRVMRAAGLSPSVHFVETSPLLKEAQARQVADATWHEAIDDLPERPLVVVANEFFDALPIRQWVEGRERKVGIAAGGLAFDRDGPIEEDSPARAAAMAALAGKLVRNGGVALVIDYGHGRTAPGDTLQAVRRHNFAHVLEAPGEQDLTSHVDFEALAKAAQKAGGAVTKVVEQGPWLERLGIIARASALAARAPERAAEIEAARARLCRPDAMGALFKVMAVHSPQWPVPAGF